MEREIIITGFTNGIISPDLMSSDLGNGVKIKRKKNIEYLEKPDAVEGTEETDEVITEQLEVVYNSKQMYLIDLTELEIDAINNVLNHVSEDYDIYITDKALYNLGNV